MEKDREIKRPNGSYLHLEKPGYGLLIKDGIVVNEDQYNLFLERKKQNALAPTSTPSEVAQKLQEELKNIESNKVEKLEKEVQGLNSKLDAILDKLSK